MVATAVLKRPKKLIVCCDGTWMDSDSGWDEPSFNPFDWHPHGQLQAPSNVTRITYAIKPVDERDEEHHPQIVYYQAGLGTGWTLTNRMIGGGIGRGISENVREAYDFLANNYAEGDLIFLIGFSRGAFTARSVGGLIGDFGLLKKKHLHYFHDIFSDWEMAGSSTYTPELPKRMKGAFVLGSKVADKDAYLKEYRQKLDDAQMTRSVKIEAIGVWDTVGSLGIPTTVWLQELGLPTTLHSYRFFNTELGNHVKNAFQALALDEHRCPFSPTLWEKKAGCQTNLKQVWFPGTHANIGGGYPDQSLANITLAWMMSQLEKWMDFDDDYVADLFAATERYFEEHDYTRPKWSEGLLPESAVGLTAAAGKKRRTPGCYQKIDYDKGHPLGVHLEDTNESIHASVRARIKLPGHGYDGKGVYNPRAKPAATLADWTNPGGALLDWELHDDSSQADTPPERVHYEYVGDDESVRQRQLFEDELGKYEKMLLEKRSEHADQILKSSADSARASKVSLQNGHA